MLSAMWLKNQNRSIYGNLLVETIQHTPQHTSSHSQTYKYTTHHLSYFNFSARIRQQQQSTPYVWIGLYKAYDFINSHAMFNGLLSFSVSLYEIEIRDIDGFLTCCCRMPPTLLIQLYSHTICVRRCFVLNALDSGFASQ